VVYEFMTDNGVTALTTRDNDPYVLYAVDFSGEVYALLPRNFDRLEAGASARGFARGFAEGSDAARDSAGDSNAAELIDTSAADTSPASKRQSKTGLFARLFGGK
jgi:hypothetical protein